ncbi:hypothetical protein [Streptomyces virginiae]|uniref:hypothetical protein n=1 Tax=Streptomyces virginiae TaxID=1961 RepID=UPI00365535BF
MGHWSEGLVDKAAQLIGGNADRQVVREALELAGREIDTLAGRTFQPLRRAISVIEPNGLPFVDIPDLQVGSLESEAGAWAVPDPVNPEMSIVLQVAPLGVSAPRAAPVGDALRIAGQLVARASQEGYLSADYILQRLGTFVDHEQRVELFRRVMNPAVRFYVPILALSANGWWFQIARRLIWVTSETEDAGRLLELLLPEASTGVDTPPLAASEAILIATPMTQQRASWAFTARVWTEHVERPTNRPWRRLATAIHGNGIPTITVDSVSTPYEVACQVVLKAYWHGYLSGDESALVRAIAMAHPEQVARIQRETRAPNQNFAAATLLEQLVRPGFDPAQGAEATRRYVRRKASIAVLQYRKGEAPERYPWTQVGISERRYYKLLPQFAKKINGRYDYELDDVVSRMKAHLNRADKAREIRATALNVLRAHGFGDEAARKWLQRHPPEEAVHAWPRGRRPSVSARPPR